MVAGFRGRLGRAAYCDVQAPAKGAVSGHQMLAAIDGNNRAGNTPRGIAHQERRQSSDIVDIHQLALRRGGGLGGQQFVEMRDPAGGPGFDRPG